MSANLLEKFRVKLTVYEHDGGPASTVNILPAADMFIPADRYSVRSLFGNDPERCQKFIKFLDQGFRGVFLAHDGEWASYGWFSEPGGHVPFHLTASLARGAYWIFHCHTRQELRGRGYFGKVLCRIVESARQERPDAPVCIDTLFGNVASRRAILSAGFRPRGVITTYRLWVPRVSDVVLSGAWRREQPHPAIA